MKSVLPAFGFAQGVMALLFAIAGLALTFAAGRTGWEAISDGLAQLGSSADPRQSRVSLPGPEGFVVGDLWGTGTHPFTVDGHAAPVAPAWRWDSKALAYVTAAGAVVVHDVIGGANRPLLQACGIHRPAAIAFAPAGAELAVADRRGGWRSLTRQARGSRGA